MTFTLKHMYCLVLRGKKLFEKRNWKNIDIAFKKKQGEKIKLVLCIV